MQPGAGAHRGKDVVELHGVPPSVRRALSASVPATASVELTDASSPQTTQPGCALPRANSSRNGPELHASKMGYISSGLRECSRLRVSTKLTCRRPGASVRAFL